MTLEAAGVAAGVVVAIATVATAVYSRGAHRILMLQQTDAEWHFEPSRSELINLGPGTAYKVRITVDPDLRGITPRDAYDEVKRNSRVPIGYVPGSPQTHPPTLTVDWVRRRRRFRPDVTDTWSTPLVAGSSSFTSRRRRSLSDPD